MKIRVCGVEVKMRPGAVFILLACCIEGFHFGGWMTVVTSVCYCLCAGCELLITSDTERRGSMRDYGLLAVLTTAGMYFTNWALNYLNYTTRIVFKSSKVVPTMILGTVLQGRRYSLGEYSAAALLVAGISLFTLGDVEVNPRFHAKGVLLIVVALFADAATSNFEEKRFFRVASPSSQAEVIFYSSAIASVYGMLVLLPTGELMPALAHSMANRTVVPLLSLAAVCGYFSVTFVLLLIKHFGATNTEIVKSLRKVLSILLSFLIYPKPMNTKYLGGLVATVLSLVISFRLKRRKPTQGGAGAAAGAGGGGGGVGGKGPGRQVVEG